MNGNFQWLNIGTGDYLHCDTGIWVPGIHSLAAQISSFSDVWDEFGAFIG